MTLNLASYLAQGYGAEEILQFVSKTFPNIGRAISAKKNAGIDLKDILKLIASLDAKQLRKADKNATGMNFDNPLERANYAAKQQENNPLLQAAKVGGGALAGAAALGAAPLLGRGVQAATQAASKTGIPPTPFQSTIQPSMQEGMPPKFQEGQAFPVSALDNIQQNKSTSGLQAQGISQPQYQQTMAPSSQQPPGKSLQSAQILKQMNLEGKINDLLKAGNDPKTVADAIQFTLKPGEKKWLDEQIKSGNAAPLDQMVQDYVQTQGGQKSQQGEQTAPEINQKTEESAQRPEKGNIISTPDGLVGEIKDIKKTEALVESDGKLHKVKIDKLELPDEELIKRVEELLDLPEEEKSSIISSLIYRPRKQEMMVKYHNGESYVYEGITEDEIAPIADAMGVPVTSGQNFYGKWEKGKQDSRGAALIHGILRSPKFAKENEGKTWDKLETKYDRYKRLHKQSKRKRSR